MKEPDCASKGGVPVGGKSWFERRELRRSPGSEERLL